MRPFVLSVSRDKNERGECGKTENDSSGVFIVFPQMTTTAGNNCYIIIINHHETVFIPFHIDVERNRFCALYPNFDLN